jgi:HD-like signal output (HDOD) protein
VRSEDFGILQPENGSRVTIYQLHPVLNATHFNGAAVRTPYWALRGLPPFPPVAAQLLRMLSTDDYQTHKLVDLIATDPVFTKELLHMVNSSGAGFQTNSVRHVVAILGKDTLKSFAVALNLRIYMGDVVRHQTLAKVWRHSLATAILSELLTESCPGLYAGPGEEAAYVAGLLHKVGALGLMVANPPKYAEAIAIATERGVDLRDVEQSLFEIDHCQAGRWIALKWRFSPAIARLASDGRPPVSRKEFKPADLVKVAGLFADSLGYEVVPMRPALTFNEVRAMLPDMAQDKFAWTDSQLKLKVDERMSTLMEGKQC